MRRMRDRKNKQIKQTMEQWEILKEENEILRLKIQKMRGEL